MHTMMEVVGLTVHEALQRLEAGPAEAPERTQRSTLAAAGLAATLAVLALAGAAMRPSAAVLVAPPASAPRAARAETADAGGDADYLAELGEQVERRSTTWTRELADAEQLIADSGVEPRRVLLRADDVFAGARSRPRCEIEGTVRDGGTSLPPSSAGALTVRRYGDRTSEDGASTVRTLDAYW